MVSIEGITSSHAFLQIISKESTIAVFAFGTTILASATLMSVSATLMVLSLVFSAGVLGRVAAMWIASEMNKSSSPILQAVVKNKEDAGKYVEEILQLDGLLIEIMGHVIINQNIIMRKNEWFCWARYVGLLAPPSDIIKLATRPTPKELRQFRPDRLMLGLSEDV